MPRILAIDQSTSATKALILDENRNVLARESIGHAQSYPQPGFVEQDAAEILGNTRAVCTKLIQKLGGNEPLAFASISNQRETVVVFDRDSGDPLFPAVVWQCRRGTEKCSALKADGKEEWVHRRTGLTLDPYFSASKVNWLIRNHPGLEEKLAAGEALVGTIDSFLIYNLTGRTVFATDHTNASRTLLYNIHDRDWDDDLCRLWRIPGKALPEIRDCSDAFGKMEMAGKTVELRGVMGDSHASLFSQRCFAPGTTKVTLGTGSSILMNIGPQAAIADNGVLTTVGWSHDRRTTYAFEGIIVAAASTLEWLKSNLGILEDASKAEELAVQVDSNAGVYLVPAFNGLGLPYWAASARASICGLTNGSDRRHVVRAALESIAYQLRAALQAMNEAAPAELKSVQADGGPTTNSFLMQFIADLIRIPVNTSSTVDGSALGAAMMGMLGAGLVTSMEELAQTPGGGRSFTPQMPEREAGSLFEGWNRAVAQVLSQNIQDD